MRFLELKYGKQSWYRDDEILNAQNQIHEVGVSSRNDCLVYFLMPGSHLCFPFPYYS